MFTRAVENQVYATGVSLLSSSERRAPCSSVTDQKSLLCSLAFTMGHHKPQCMAADAEIKQVKVATAIFPSSCANERHKMPVASTKEMLHMEQSRRTKRLSDA